MIAARLLTALLTLFAAIGISQTALADDTKHVEVVIYADHQALEGGETVLLAIEKNISPGWHTYWKNPGDSGAPLSIAWDLPEGFSVEEFVWPTPKRIPYDPLVNFGYKHQAVVLQTLNIPETAPPSELTINGKYQLLVCEELCIPESGTVSISFNSDSGIADVSPSYFDTAKAALPTPYTQTVHYDVEQSELVLKTQLETQVQPDRLFFFANDNDLLQHAAAPKIRTLEDGRIEYRQALNTELNSDSVIEGVLAVSDNRGQSVGYTVSAIPSGLANTSANEQSTAASHQSEAESSSFLMAALFALLGGLVLNLMPCVFPVLSMKALSLIHMGDKSASVAIRHGWAYTAGIILSFLAIATVLIALKAFGFQVGWGFQLQNPLIVGVLAYLLLLVGLNLSGFFEISVSFSHAGQSLTEKEGASGSFFTGVLAALVAAPCVAPFMGAAIGYALTQPPAVALIVFAMLGLGLALPYLLLCYFPSLRSRLPRPGPWMARFKELLAFPMYASAIWLVWVLSQQAGSNGVLVTLSGMLVLVFAIWFRKLVANGGLVWKRLVNAAAIVLVVGALFPLTTLQPSHAAPSEQAFSQTALDQTLETKDHPVFVEMTAAWCITCKVNERVALNLESTTQAFEQHQVERMIGDWTNYDSHITQYLEGFGRNGVPLYVYYGPRDEQTGQRPDPVLLPQILTPGIVEDYLSGS